VQCSGGHFAVNFSSSAKALISEIMLSAFALDPAFEAVLASAESTTEDAIVQEIYVSQAGFQGNLAGLSAAGWPENSRRCLP
jgi:hypothetical protein